MKLGKYLCKRLCLMIAVLLGASVISFVLVRVIPGDPARMMMPPQSSPEDIERKRQELGLYDPYYKQYLSYVGNLLQGDLGFSYHTGRPVLEDFRLRFPATLELAIVSLTLAAAFGITLGVLSATHKNSALDHLCRLFSIGGISAPSFWIGLIGIYVFYFVLGWLPAPTGRLGMMTEAGAGITGLYLVDSLLTGNISLFTEALRCLILPSTVLAYSFLAMICRLTRSGMIEASQQDYTKFFTICGVSQRKIVWKYSLKNGIRPVMTMLGMFMAQLLGGVVFIETVFNWPGIGRYAVDSINYLDYTPIQGLIILMALIYTVMNLLVDMLYMLLDPRVQY